MRELVDHVRTNRGYVMVGDSRGVLVPCKLRNKVWQWAEENKIKIEYQGTLDAQDLWYVKKDQDRDWFVLKWA
jgi:hypothetical protein